RLHAEFLDRIGERKRQIGVEEIITVVAAVQSELEIVLPRAIYRQRLDSRSRVSIQARIAAGATLRLHARDEQREVRQIAAIQRQIHDAPGVYNFLNGGVAGLNSRSGSLDGHRGRQLADFKANIDLDVVIDLQL